ncbi:VOC family protein [Pigmentiphaga sp. YJ18]|uniref:VOC family protein n=1 Tax=Pigmentiphaga sp. YJ18 TaxID=3134907 RepID=UPI003116A554
MNTSSHGIEELDHLMTYVADLDAAGTAYERLGFRLTPVSNIASMGIANRLVPMRPRTPGAANFIELMGVADASLLPAPMREVLSGAPGIKSMVMMTGDAQAAHRMLVDAGYPFAAPSHVRREWAIPGEGSVWPEFDVLLPIPAPLKFNVCQYHNVELYLREDWLEHPNTAESLLAAIGVASDARSAAAYFERLFGVAAVRSADGGHAVSPGRTELVLYEPAAFEARFGCPAPAGGDGVAYAGMRIAVRDRDRLAALLDANGVPHARVGGIVVDPRSACGNVIEFVERTP